MKLFNLICVGFFLLLAGCGGGGGSDKSSAPQGQQGAPDESKDYLQVADLNLAHTYEDLKNVKSNLVQIQGTGSKSTYRISYRFNSGNNTSLRLIETLSQHHESGTCSKPEIKWVLKSADQEPVNLNLLSSTILQASKEYTIDVEIPASCKEMNVSIDMIAWIGNAQVEPYKALVCRGQRSLVTFFPTVNVLTGYSSELNQGKFLDVQSSYCGESFTGKDIQCASSLKPFLFSAGSTTVAQVECSAKHQQQWRSFSMNYDSANGNAQVVCRSQDRETFSENFACKPQIVDYKNFRRF